MCRTNWSQGSEQGVPPSAQQATQQGVQPTDPQATSHHEIKPIDPVPRVEEEGQPSGTQKGKKGKDDGKKDISKKASHLVPQHLIKEPTGPQGSEQGVPPSAQQATQQGVQPTDPQATSHHEIKPIDPVPRVEEEGQPSEQQGSQQGVQPSVEQATHQCVEPTGPQGSEQGVPPSAQQATQQGVQPTDPQATSHHEIKPIDPVPRHLKKKDIPASTTLGLPTDGGKLLFGYKDSWAKEIYETENSLLEHDRVAISVFVERMYPETDTFHMSFGEMTITPDDVVQILNLPDQGTSVKLNYTKQLSWAQLYALTKKCLGTLEKEQKGTLTDEQVDHAATAYLLCILGCVIFPNTSGNRIDANLLQLLDPLHEVGDYSWGTTCLAFLMEELRKASRLGTCQVAGKVALLQAWIYDNFPILKLAGENPEWRKGTPRGTKYTFEYNRSRTKEQQLIRMMEILDQLKASDVCFDPYKEDRASGHINVRSDLSLYFGPLWHPTGYVMYNPSRMMRQHGYIQHQPMEEFGNYYKLELELCSPSGDNLTIVHKGPPTFPDNWDKRTEFMNHKLTLIVTAFGFHLHITTSNLMRVFHTSANANVAGILLNCAGKYLPTLENTYQGPFIIEGYKKGAIEGMTSPIGKFSSKGMLQRCTSTLTYLKFMK
ncbi:hypothetical protein C5167_016493 [Papaver somniferum]|nr:hypothetical protein C5167_016493 [Papaver somniferum]